MTCLTMEKGNLVQINNKSLIGGVQVKINQIVD